MTKNATGQELLLKLTSNEKNSIQILSNLKFKKTHKDSTSLYNQLKLITEQLKSKGYFLNELSEVKKTNKQYLAFFKLGKKVSFVKIKINKADHDILHSKSQNKDYLILPIEKLENQLSEINSKMDALGEVFSKTQLQNINIKKDTLYADLKITTSKKRYIDKVVLKGYRNFPSSYIKNHYNLSNEILFNTELLSKVSERTKALNFVKETRKPEVLFKSDSTLLYIYLQNTQNNSIDGMINFVNDDNGDFLITGNLDLKLQNILNTGETLHLFWNSAGNQRQEFNIETKIPYLFHSKISAEINFHLYRQDSTFSNTSFALALNYPVSSEFYLGGSFSTESSNSSNNNSQALPFSNFFGGIHLGYTKEHLNIAINPQIGHRKSDEITPQMKLSSKASYLWLLSNRSSIFFRNETGILASDNYLINELYRIGGARSIRGFNEQEFFVENFSYINTEFRFKTNDQSYLYTITDFGRLFQSSSNTNLLGLGLGYVFRKNNLELNTNIAIGSRNNQGFDLNNTKLIVSWVNYF